MDISCEQWHSPDYKPGFYVKLVRAYYELWREIRDAEIKIGFFQAMWNARPRSLEYDLIY